MKAKLQLLVPSTAIIILLMTFLAGISHGANPCDPPKLTFITTPEPSNGATQFTLTARTAIRGPGIIVRWWDSKEGGNILKKGVGGMSWQTPKISTTTTYYVDAVSKGCASARVPVVMTINPVQTQARKNE